MTYEELSRIVFESESSRKASLGKISTDAHWAAVTGRLGHPASDARSIREEFFAGDIVDTALVDFIRSLRPRYKTGVISNAWPDLRDYLAEKQLDDAFDTLVISAEVGIMKPEPRIYQIALDNLGVSAREAAFVDDTPPNVEAASALGMHGILFREPVRALRDLKEIMK